MGNAPDKAAFDRHARDYAGLMERSVRTSGYPASFFAERKVLEMRDTLQAAGALDRPFTVLNFGCGIGSSEPYLAREFPQADIRSIDVSEESLAVARENCRDMPKVSFSAFDGRTIPFPGPVDVILVAGVLHHIAPAERPAILQELRRVLADDGLIFIFEHNPANPLTRRAVRDCPFDDDAVLLSPRTMRALFDSAGLSSTVRYIHFFPRALKGLLGLERYLRWLPLGAQYYCIAGHRP
jgi:SAM-dependent methyltransferase